jgi:ribosomal protein S18 acetylase RimI-like enzyme
MSHYANYINELTEATVIEDKYGFYQYSIFSDFLYIDEFYIDPQYRGFKEARRYIREMAKIAQDHNFIYLLGGINLKNSNAASVLVLHLRNKCTLSSAENNCIYVKISVEDALSLGL